MQTAQLADQAVITEDGNYRYLDNTPESIAEKAFSKERERILKHINESTELVGGLDQVKHLVSQYDLATEYEHKALELQPN